MDTLTIRAEPFADFADEALDAAHQLETDEESPNEAVLSFQTAEQVTELLTPKRLELLKSTMEDPAESIRALARRLDRNISEVHADLERFTEYGIIDYRDSDGRSKQPYCPYDTINIDVTLSVT